MYRYCDVHEDALLTIFSLHHLIRQEFSPNVYSTNCSRFHRVRTDSILNKKCNHRNLRHSHEDNEESERRDQNLAIEIEHNLHLVCFFPMYDVRIDQKDVRVN